GIRVKILFQSQCLVSPQDNTFQRLAYLCLRVSPQDNPFRQRIAEVLSEDGEGNMTLDDFLDKFSLLMAFVDLEKTLNKLKRNEQMEDTVQMVCEKVINKADLDNDGRMSLATGKITPNLYLTVLTWCTGRIL
uniref:Calcium and integrin binding family member 3 n=1 Tax=Oncorhynchus kisutch TaxID=8019 RepID=A0A8C7KXK4_ONCKI